MTPSVSELKSIPLSTTNSGLASTSNNFGNRNKSIPCTPLSLNQCQNEAKASGTIPSCSALAMSVTGSADVVKRESYKDRRKHYQKEKKRVAEELLSTLTDPTVVVLTDWLKVRGTLKGWTKLWCELKPGLLVLYKSPKTRKSSQWVGTVLLNICEVIERPSKKDGFCFKLFNPLEQSIWASKGPKGESFGALMLPLPMSYLIFRAPSEQAGKTWMDAIELSLRCSSFLARNMAQKEPLTPLTHNLSTDDGSPPQSASFSLNETEMEQHFQDHDLGDDDAHSDHEEHAHEKHSTDSDSDNTDVLENLRKLNVPGIRMKNGESQDDTVVETHYVENHNGEDLVPIADESGVQCEEVADENKSLLWSLLKQVRPGMDLSKVVLPTFILEPRSFLEKLTDYYYHCDILSKAVLEDDPLYRMEMIVKFYLSGFYKKPKGLKKPYNPILGETFRCYWLHPETHSRTFYIAEQVSHHPPISAFYVTNRKDGFCISGSILAKSKFYGNSVSAILDGTARLTLLTRGEDYLITMPYAHCKGILMGTLTLELGGKVEIKCEKTGYYTELEFKLKPFLGGSEFSNLVVGKIKLGKETLASIEGHWDTSIKIKHKKTGNESVLWLANAETRSHRLKRFTVPLEEQTDFESEKLWRKVSIAIHRGDQFAATEEKTILEEAQRKAYRDRQTNNETWVSKHFAKNLYTGEWVYIHADSRPWDPRTDVLQYEKDFVIQTKTRHRTPTVGCRTNSIVSTENQLPFSTASLKQSKEELLMRRKHHRKIISNIEYQISGESSPDTKSGQRTRESNDTTESDDINDGTERKSNKVSTLRQILESINTLQKEDNNCLQEIQRKIDLVLEKSKAEKSATLCPSQKLNLNFKEVFIVLLISIITQIIINISWEKIRKS
ncbi:Oxysterol-binding protein-related protein 8-like protein [Dinothrombium tinctorium]|uniref:Oxysterol-binding protein n=1 Tax=Dinothrombium tinctorium TaxID=1965070 RepID=A0A3S3P7R1_9ACAR|nr:Oxysterol-binding protein-related protein 8-like protein [Dinothrombium tinctorium]